jgi:DNA-binding CsgD family transcriptional regulator/PAS domain-containing protein
MNDPDADALPGLIGRIYGCVLSPDAWNETLVEVGALARCAKVCIMDIARRGPGFRIHRHSEIEQRWHEAYKPEYVLETQHLFEHSFHTLGSLPDVPMVLSRAVPRHIYTEQAVFKDWAVPQGLCDSLACLVSANSARIACVIAMRSIEQGDHDDYSIGVMTLLMPHLRRAIAISDLLDPVTLEAAATRSLIDALALGIVLVDADGRIVEANAEARDLLRSGDLVRDVDGVFTGATAESARALRAAIITASTPDRASTEPGFGIALRPGQPTGPLAHVMPLAGAGHAAGLTAPRRAVAAIFIAGTDLPRAAVMQGIGRVFGLTDAERGVLEVIARGEGADVAAAKLGIAVATARAHMKRIFAKLGVDRQAELVSLLARIAPPMK